MAPLAFRPFVVCGVQLTMSHRISHPSKKRRKEGGAGARVSLLAPWSRGWPNCALQAALRTVSRTACHVHGLKCTVWRAACPSSRVPTRIIRVCPRNLHALEKCPLQVQFAICIQLHIVKVTLRSFADGASSRGWVRDQQTNRTGIV